MHGKMSPEDKDAVMNNFSKIGSDINILVATTVIEVNCHVHPSYLILSFLLLSVVLSKITHVIFIE